MTKKICFITTVSYTMDAFILKFAQYLKETENYDITLMCNPDPIFEAKIPSNIRFVPMVVKRGLDFNLFSNIYKYYKFFKKEKFDLIQYCTPNATLYSSIGGKLAGIKNRLYCQWGIYYAGQKGLKRLVFKITEKISCMNSTLIEPDSKSNMYFSIKEGLYSSKKSRVIGSGSSRGVDLEVFDYKKREEYSAEVRKQLGLKNEFIFGYLGRLNKDKGLSELLMAFKELDINAKLLLVGPSESIDEIDKDLYEWSKNNENVYYLPSTDEPYKFFSAFNVNVLPSYREGMPSAMLEAMAMKTLVLATDINGINDVIKNNENGILVKVRDYLDLKEKMLYSFENFKNLNNLKENAYNLIIEEFDQKKVFELTRKDRKKILNDK
jgi:glycosyltransferase involved in cell wall biosynthesis